MLATSIEPELAFNPCLDALRTGT